MAAHSHARDLLAHPYRAMEPQAVGLAKSNFGCSTLLLGAPPPLKCGLGAFFFFFLHLVSPVPLGFTLGEVLLVVWTQTGACLGDFGGDAGPPSLGSLSHSH